MKEMEKAKLFFHRLRASAAGRAATAAFAVLFLAQSIPVANGLSEPTNLIQSTDDITKLFCSALLWMFWGLIVVSIAMFLVGGYIYATSAGEPEKVGRATKTLTYAAIAMVIALVAGGVPLFIGKVFGAGNLNACGS